MRRDEKSGHDIAQHKRLLELLEQQRHCACNNKNQREVENQGFHQSLYRAVSSQMRTMTSAAFCITCTETNS